MIRHSSIDDDSEQSSDQPNGHRKSSLFSVHGPKSPELLEEIREQKFQKQRLTGRLTHIDPVASLQGRFSFLRRSKKQQPPNSHSHSTSSSSTVTTMEMPTMYPRRQTGKEFEFDMEQEVEHEKERLANLPPGGENIWA